MTDPTAELAFEALARGLPVRFCARGASMRPWVRDGDVLVLAPDAELADVGDLVLVPVSDFGVVHRVVARWGHQVWVKGDALPWPDGWFDRRRLKARVVAIERGGRLVAMPRLAPVARSLATGPLRLLKGLISRIH